MASADANTLPSLQLLFACLQGSLDDQVVEETGPEAVDWLKRRRRRKRALNNMPPEMEGKGGVSAKGIFFIKKWFLRCLHVRRSRRYARAQDVPPHEGPPGIREVQRKDVQG